MNRSTNYPTRCSLVFDPEAKDIYVALEGNFDKIWKVSLENETLETFRGFDRHFVMDIGEGVTASQLNTLENEVAEYGFVWIGVLGVIVGTEILNDSPTV